MPTCKENTPLEYGQLTRRSDQKIMAYQIRRISMPELDNVMEIQEQTFQALENPALYYPSPRHVFEESLSDNGLVIGCYVANTLIGFRSIWYPGIRSENLGKEIGINSVEQLNQVAHLERACVLPDYRGNKLQICMTNNAVKLAREKRFFRYLFSTVAPLNYASMQDKFASNMVIVRLLKKYEDYYRYIFYQDIIKPIKPLMEISEITSIRGDDVASQLIHLNTNEKMIGFRQFRENDLTYISFAKIDFPLF